MGKVIFGIWVWCLLGGAVNGAIHAYTANKCGKPLYMSNDLAATIIAWPGTITYVLFLNDSNYKARDICKEDSQGDG